MKLNIFAPSPPRPPLRARARSPSSQARGRYYRETLWEKIGALRAELGDLAGAIGAVDALVALGDAAAARAVGAHLARARERYPEAARAAFAARQRLRAAQSAEGAPPRAAAAAGPPGGGAAPDG